MLVSFNLLGNHLNTQLIGGVVYDVNDWFLAIRKKVLFFDYQSHESVQELPISIFKLK